MAPLRVLLVQLPVPNNPTTNMPLAAGYLKAYAQAQGVAGEQAEITILPRQLVDHAGDALLVEAIVAHAPDLLGFSLYTWNSERSLAIAAQVKARLPDLLVIGGGPEVQPDTAWLLTHPGLDIGVIGEGEQTFVALLQHVHATDDITRLDAIPGLAYRGGDEVQLTAPRLPLDDLADVPSPYLAGYLDVLPGSMALVEVSRWCPYACSFCLYGRNMGTKLGRRFFGLERILAEIAYARTHGATAIHFVEANLNLIPFFRPLMAALEDLNADRALALYAELRGEHLNAEVVAALDRAGLRVAEVGLQTANPVALAASRRKTDLRKWAAGTRRLLAHDIEVLLDVILGLPQDDAAGVQTTLDFIEQEQLGNFDIFMLQVLPGTAIRQHAAESGLAFQERPPYYVLHTDRLSHADLRHLRRELKLQARMDPDAIDGLPEPRREALQRGTDPAAAPPHSADLPIEHLVLTAGSELPVNRLARHVDLIVRADDLLALTLAVSAALTANPTTLFDLYLLCDSAPTPAALRAWRDALPHTPGYLDRLAVYQQPLPGEQRVSPRLWLLLPWIVQAEPEDYAPFAGIIWQYELQDEEPPLGAWRTAGGAGIRVPGATLEQADAWRVATGLRIWI
jgi:radical SAM superfamily enzyme YgiQ (UPF0313 family)